MDQRQSLGRTPSASLPQSPYNNPNMASTYSMSYQNPNHLPPIQNFPPNIPPHNQSYMPQYSRPELNRYQSAPAPSPTPDRYNQHMGPQHTMQGLPPASMLPQPNAHQQPQQQSYSTPPSATPTYQQQQRLAPALAPAPPRPNLDALSTNFGQGPDRPPMWSGAEQIPGMQADALGAIGRDPNVHHVVGSQGRRGILPSAPGRPPVAPNGMNGSPKQTSIPVKDADGKFPCPNCNKTYLHAKHLKRHMLRHTGDRPYMCVLCNDTFSRSDILKRHFQKCSVRRGNPTGASHLSNPAAHLKKNQAAAAKAATESPASTTTPSTAGLPNGQFTSAAMGPGPMTTTSTPYSDAPPMPYNMAASSNDMHRTPQGQQTQGVPSSNSMNAPTSNAWSMQHPRNPILYNSNPTTPDHFAMGAGGHDDKRDAMHAPHQMGNDWQQMFQPGANDSYMNPMYAGYQEQHHDMKKYDGGHEQGQNGYYVSSTSLGADGTLGPPLWNPTTSEEDPLQLKAERLVDFCFPGGIQESLQEQQNNFHIRSCLTAESVKHFLELFSNFQGHFPYLHISTFNFLEAYDGVILAIICIGAVYSDRVSQHQQTRLVGSYRVALNLKSSKHFSCYKQLASGMGVQSSEPVRERKASSCSNLFQLVKQFQMLNLAGSDDPVAFSYLHNLPQNKEPDLAMWNWNAWIEQEKRSRFMFLVFLLDAALVIYFNCVPQLLPSDLTLPLPCDDSAWEAGDAASCARALGLYGPGPQHAINQSGSLRPKQLEMNFVMAALHDSTYFLEPRSTNVYSKFILIHALHIEIWQVQRQRSLADSAQASPTDAHHSGPTAQTSAWFNSISSALVRWKQAWDQDMQIQYPPSSDPSTASRRFGFSRDGIHFYWLARAFMQPNRIHDWRYGADTRFQRAMGGLKKAREWSRTDGAQRGEEPGSVYDMDDGYGFESLDLDMRKLLRPIGEA